MFSDISSYIYYSFLILAIAAHQLELMFPTFALLQKVHNEK